MKRRTRDLPKNHVNFIILTLDLHKYDVNFVFFRSNPNPTLNPNPSEAYQNPNNPNERSK
jgi:hypothetical protein